MKGTKKKIVKKPVKVEAKKPFTVEKPKVDENLAKAKELAKQGLNTKEVAEALGISKFDASKLMKG